MTTETGEASSSSVNKMLKFNLLDKEDRISDLPDPLIHHILSFLPSTKQAVQSGILSSRWRNQWTYVPTLIFRSTGMSCDSFFRSIDNVLNFYNCSKIRKFHLQFHYRFELVPEFAEKIRFATNRDVEELILNYNGPVREYVLPEFIFNSTSLVKLQTIHCIFLTHKVNWGFLKILSLESCGLLDPIIEKVLSGSPVLELLEIKYCDGFDRLVIGSNSLKKLVLDNLDNFVIEISCPQLEELSIKNVLLSDHIMFDEVIEHALIASPKLESLELVDCGVFGSLIVVSESLKRFVLGEFQYIIPVFEIACPMLDRLEFFGCLDFRYCKLENLPSRVFAALDFKSGVEEYDQGSCYETHESLAMDILLQLRHVQEIKIGARFMKTLSGLKVGNFPCPLLNVKCLTLDDPNLNEHLRGITSALHNSPVLETLVINVPVYRFLGLSLQVTDDPQELNGSESNYWNSNKIVFNCLGSHLKTVKVMGLPERNDKCELVLNFVEFLLKNGRVLEKMVVILEDYGTSFAAKVSQKLLSFSKCSEHAIVELLCSK